MTSTLAPNVEVWQQAYKQAAENGMSAGEAIREADAAEAAWLAEQEAGESDAAAAIDEDSDDDADGDDC